MKIILCWCIRCKSAAVLDKLLCGRFVEVDLEVDGKKVKLREKPEM